MIVDSFHLNDKLIDELNNFRYFIAVDDFKYYNFKSGLIIDWTPGNEKRKESGEISLFGLKYLAVKQVFKKRAFKRYKSIK